MRLLQALTPILPLVVAAAVIGFLIFGGLDCGRARARGAASFVSPLSAKA